MKKQIIISATIALCAALSFATTALATITPPTSTEPQTTSDCKKDGWRNYGDMFKNQGDCVSFVATNGKNPPDGPPIH